MLLPFISCAALEPAKSSNFAASISVQFTQADTTEEHKAMGYPDSRKVVRNAAGDIFVAYRKKYFQDSAERYHIFITKSDDNGQTWHVLNNDQPIEDTGDFTQRVPSIAISPDDVIHVVWYGTDAGNAGQNERQIKYVRSEDSGETWSDWKNIAKIDGYNRDDLWQEHPVIYIKMEPTSAGSALPYTIYVAWQGRGPDYGRSQIKLTQSKDGGETWRSWININPDSDTTFSRPTLVASQDKNTLYLLAYATLIDLRQIVWTQSPDVGQTWTPWISVAPSIKDQRHVSATIDDQNHLHIVWRQQVERSAADAPSQIHYATFNGHTWSAPEIIGKNSTVFQVFPSITVTKDHIWVAWSETSEAPDFPKENPSAGTIFLSIKNNQGWGPRIRLRDQVRDVYPSLGRGNAVLSDTVDLTWLESAGSISGTIHYGRLHLSQDKGACQTCLPKYTRLIGQPRF